MFFFKGGRILEYRFWVFFGSILGYFGVFWNSLEYFGVFWNILEYFGIFWNILIFFEYFGVFWWVPSGQKWKDLVGFFFGDVFLKDPI